MLPLTPPDSPSLATDDRAEQPILVIDQSDESREVICTILARRGWRTLEAQGAVEGLELAQRVRPRLIVVDLEEAVADDESLCTAYASQCRRQQADLLVMGVSRRAAGNLPSDQIIAKPYHYGALIRKIEQLCSRVAVEEVNVTSTTRAGKAA